MRLLAGTHTLDTVLWNPQLDECWTHLIQERQSPTPPVLGRWALIC